MNGDHPLAIWPALSRGPLSRASASAAAAEPAAGASTSWTRAGCHTLRNSTVTMSETSAAVTSTSPIST